MNRQHLLTIDRIFDTAKERVEEIGRRELERRLKAHDPAAYHFITRVAFDAVIDLHRGLNQEGHAAVYDAIWHAALIAIEASRTAACRTALDTNLRLWVAKLDPRFQTSPITELAEALAPDAAERRSPAWWPLADAQPKVTA